MKIEDRTRRLQEASPLGCFKRGDCIRLVHDDNFRSLNSIYLVVQIHAMRAAVSLADGSHRLGGLFVLEPNAKVVIE